jgi:uncharacterized protein YbjT (DUF2867 family)
VNILVTGATGHLGRDIMRAAVAAGHGVRALSRRPAPSDRAADWVTADLATGAGLDAAVRGVDVVLHAASDARNSAAADVRGTARLAAAARAARVSHFVYVSIVGVDRIPLAYYRHKLAAERAVAESGVPYSVVRATQFHWFLDWQLDRAARMPLVLPIPAGFHVQTIGTEDVARVLAEVVTGPPQGLLPDLAGPEAMTLAEAARVWVSVRRPGRRVVSLPIPGRVAAAFRAGHNTAPDRPSGRETWRAWLERR